MRNQYKIRRGASLALAGGGRKAVLAAVAVGLMFQAGCANTSSIKPAPQPAPAPTVTASLRNDMYPELRQLTPEEANRVSAGRALLNQLRSTTPPPGTVPISPQIPHGPEANQTAPGGTAAAAPVPRTSPANPPAAANRPGQARVLTTPPAAPGAIVAAPQVAGPPVAAPQVATPQVAEPPLKTASANTVKKPPKNQNSGFWSWLSPISAKRASEETPAQKLRQSRAILAAQRIDDSHIGNVESPGQPPAADMAPVTRTAATQPPRAREKPIRLSGARLQPVRPPAAAPAPARKPKRARRDPVTVASLDAPARPPRTTGSLTRRARSGPALVRPRPISPAVRKPAAQRQPAVAARGPRVVATPAGIRRTMSSRLPTKARPVTIYFTKGSAILSPRYNSRLRILASMQKAAGRRVHVRAIAVAGANGEGFSGTAELNQLAVSRAKAIAAKLWSYGVTGDAMILRASQERIAGAGGSTLQASRIRRADIYIE